MNLERKTSIIVLLTAAGLMANLYAVDRYLLLRSYLELERVQTRDAMQRTKVALANDIADLSKTANDYAEWDRMYEFMKHPAYIKQEFVNDTLQGLKISIVLVTDVSGKTVFAKGYDQLRNLEVRVPAELEAQLTADPWVQRELTTLSSASGILILPDGPIMIAASPILTSNRKGPIRGVLVIVRNLDGRAAKSLKDVSLTSLLITPISSPQLPPDFRSAEDRMESGDEVTYVHPLNDASVAGYALLKDIHGDPALMIRVETARAVYQRGLTSLQHLFVALSLASLMFGLTTTLLLRHIVLAPLTHLNKEVGRIRKQKTLSERIEVEGHDEIAGLGRAINDMLGALQTSGELERMNEALRKEVNERQQAERAREEATTLALLAAAIGGSLTKATNLRAGLQQSTNAFVRLLDVPLARVWTRNEAGNMLELEASAGLYTHLDGPHLRVPVGATRIGQVAELRSPLVSNDVLGAFAGYPLIVEDVVVGVLAVLSRRRLSDAALECFSSVADQIAQFIRRMRVEEALQSSNEHFQQLFATIPIPVWLRDQSGGHFLEVNDAAIQRYGYSREEFLAMKITDILAPNETPESGLAQAIDQKNVPLRQKHRVRGGQFIDVEVTAHSVEFTEVPALLVAAQDVTERNRMEVELLHGQKLQAVGALAAGVAHEINTPIQFVGDNVRFLRDAFVDLSRLLKKYDALYAGILQGASHGRLIAEVEETRKQADLEFLNEEIPPALEQTLDGVSRVATIVQALKSFSHLDLGREKKGADLNAAIQSTIEVARNELKYVAEVETDFSEMPLIDCHLGDLNQVFLNLLLNAAHSIGDVVGGTSNRGRIQVKTRIDATPDGDWAVVAISDTGKGIPEEVRSRIFEPFFTTKQVGKGSGQGLALARAIVVEKHGGTLTFVTQVGAGTTFYVRIPAKSPGTSASAAVAAGE
jgi:PAS domain S-box-containing protein